MSLQKLPRLVIAGTSSGVGKTTISVGIMAALRRRGLRVQPFKVGPDYIDPSYHHSATGVPSRNLDSWMVPEEDLLELFARACRDADIAVIEGVMGLFDGFSGVGEAGSTAQIAKRLGCPVILVIDASKMARSAAALALGYARYDPELWVAGFLLNRIAGETHYRWTKEPIEAAGIGPVLGHLTREPKLKVPERHLGLVPTQEQTLPEEFLDRLADLIESHVNIDRLLEIASSAGQVSGASRQPSADSHQLSAISYQSSAVSTHDSSLITHHSSLFPPEPIAPRATIAVAQDEAFNFYYQDNLDLLQAHGATLLPFSPLRDRAIPPEAGALYLGGGFPELHAALLAGNLAMLDSVRTAVKAGVPTYAECGGLMYLCQGIEDEDGTRHRMVGAVPGWCSMKEKRLHLGYVEVRFARENPLGPAGTQTRGHEFHWSIWDGLDPAAEAHQVLNQGSRPEGYARDNLLASFVHIHFGSNPSLAPALVESARVRSPGPDPQDE